MKKRGRVRPANATSSGDRDDVGATRDANRERVEPALLQLDLTARAFLGALLLLLLLGTLLELHGSSVGMWNRQFQDRDPRSGVLLGSPKGIRADEWAIITPAIVSQAMSRPAFPTANPRWGSARAPLIMNIPCRHWSMLARPQFWGFFALDLERAFAFYWNMKATLLLAGLFLLLMLLTGNDTVVSLLGSGWVYFSGFMQWWYSTPAMLPEMVGSFALLLVAAHYLALSPRPWAIGASAVAFILFALDFAFSLYPPFQVPLFYLGLAILVGSLVPRLRSGEGRAHLALRSVSVALALAVVAALLLAYYRDAKETIDLVRGTVYPGARFSTGGGLTLAQVFGGLYGFFMSEQSYPKAWLNVCEASSFLPLFPAPALALLWWRFRGQRVRPLEWSLCAYLLILLTWMALGWPHVLAAASGFGRSQPIRTQLGSGLAGILLCCVFLSKTRFRLPNGAGPSLLIAAAAVASLIAFSLYFNHVTTGFATSEQIAIVTLVAAAAVYFLLTRKRIAFAACVLVPSVVCFGLVNPLSAGLGPILDARLFREVATVVRQDPDARWAFYGSYGFGDFAKAAGAQVFNATKVVPPLDDLRRIDPRSSSASIYNRYAHMELALGEGPDVRFALYNQDTYAMKIDPRSDLLPRLGVRYVAGPSAVKDPAFLARTTLVREIPEAGLWLYRYR